MRKLIIAFLGLLLVGGGSELKAQQDAQYSMYMFNGLALNPAYAGSRGVLSAMALYRHQWSGLEGAPKTAVANVHAPLMNDRMGLGLSIASDNIGLVNMINITGNYAYRLTFKDDSKLAFGLNVTLNNFRGNWSEAALQDRNDPSFNASSSLWNPNFGFGVYYNSDRWFAGISVPHLLNNSLSREGIHLEGNDNVARQYKHYFFTGGAIFTLTENVKMRPSFLFKYVQNARLSTDINLGFLFREVFWLAASYRIGDAVVGMIEYDINDIIRIGYAYDYTLSELTNYTSGSHEIMLGFELRKKQTHLTPRRMSYF
ncbi:MAG: type IX secretion system membrane protein PorP/SprF [Chitinophagales bacterium]